MSALSMNLTGNIHFKIRFNTMHGDTNLFWRIILGNDEHLASSLDCKVSTYSDASFDVRAGVIKYHIAGDCRELVINEYGHAVFS